MTSALRMLLLLMLVVISPQLASVQQTKAVTQEQGGVFRKAPDISFIRIGRTTRTEVSEKLAKFDVGVKLPHFFIARWSRISYAVLIGGPTLDGQNLLIEFDDGSKVKRDEIFADKLLVARLRPIVASQPFIDLSHPVRIPARLREFSGDLVLTPGVFTFEEGGTPNQPYSFRLAATDITVVGPSPYQHPRDPANTEQVIHFSKKIWPSHSWSHRAVGVELAVPDLVTLLKFIEQSKADQQGAAKTR
jgi:hypothetical protein